MGPTQPSLPPALQTANTVLWVALGGYVMSADCSWKDLTVVMLGWGQWTLWNIEFLLIIIQGHSGNVWHGGRFSNMRHPRSATSTEAAAKEDKLVLDAPW